MKFLTPEKYKVEDMYAITENDSQIVRRFHLGYFDPSITCKDVAISLDKEKLWYKVGHSDLTTYLVSYPKVITSGVIFDKIEEFAGSLKNGVYFEDIIAMIED